jgi:hypothetical protein
MTPLPFISHDLTWAWPSLVWYGMVKLLYSIVIELGRVWKPTVWYGVFGIAWHVMDGVALFGFNMGWRGVAG